MNRKPNLENLKPFKKGQTGNPAGRPKKIPTLDNLLADVLGEETKEGITIAEKILKALSLKAMKGDVRAAEVLFDRAYGRVNQNHRIELEKERIITVKLPEIPGEVE